MDPVITPIVAAIAAGAAAGLKEDATQAARDAYSAIKSFLKREYSKVNLSPIEEKPGSPARQAALAEDLAEAGADRDPELHRLIDALVSATVVNQGGQNITVTVKDQGKAYTAGRDQHFHG